jgi:hypothetical protein
MKPNLNGRIDRLEQEHNCGRKKYSVKEMTDRELAEIIAAGDPNLTPEMVLAMSESELAKLIEALERSGR